MNSTKKVGEPLTVEADDQSEWDFFWQKRNQTPLGRIISWVRKRYVTRALVRYILSNTERGTLIEAGSGTGEVTLRVASERGDKVVLVDRSSEALILAKNRAEEYQVYAELVQCDIMDLSKYVSPDSENIVYNIGVVEHFDDCSTILYEMAKVSGKYAIAIIPERSFFWKTFIAFSRMLNLVPDGFIVYLHDSKTFKTIIEGAGMEIHWSRRIRMFGIIPYLGVCFGLVKKGGE